MKWIGSLLSHKIQKLYLQDTPLSDNNKKWCIEYNIIYKLFVRLIA